MEKFVTYFGDVFQWLNDNDVVTNFLKFDFIIISLKKQNLATSYIFRLPKSKIKGRLGAESPQRCVYFFGHFLAQCLKKFKPFRTRCPKIFA